MILKAQISPTNRRFAWYDCRWRWYKMGMFEMLLLVLIGFASIMLLQGVIFCNPLLEVKAQFGKSVQLPTIFDDVSQDDGSFGPSSNAKVKDARVMARQYNIWRWGKISSIDKAFFTVILDDDEGNIQILDRSDIKTELEASSWLTDLYQDDIQKTEIDAELPSSTECGYKPICPFSWISGAPRSLLTSRKIGSRVMARNLKERKWYWGNICQVLDDEQYLVKYDNGDIIRVLGNEVLTEAKATLWIMKIYYNSNLQNKLVEAPSPPKSLQARNHTDSIMAKSMKKDFGKFWVGGLSVHPKISLVISVCHETLDWLEELISGYEIHKLTVISKCGVTWGENTFPKIVEFIKLPNVGRCDHSYAYYLAYVHKQSALDNEIVFFLKDNIGVRRPARARSLDRMLRVVDEKGFACFEEPLWGLSSFHETRTYSTFSMAEYKRLERDKKESFKNPLYNNLLDYTNALNISLPTPLIEVCYGGNFAVRSSNIHKWPKEFWIDIEKKLSRADNIEEGHFQERLWAGILSEPLTFEETQTVLNNTQLVDPMDYSGGLVGTLTRVEKIQFGNISVSMKTKGKKMIDKTESAMKADGDDRILVFLSLAANDFAEANIAEKTASDYLSHLRPEHELFHVDTFGVPMNISANATKITHHDKISKDPVTLQSLWQHCRINRSDKVVYIHTEVEKKKKILGSIVSKGALSKECGALPLSCNVCSTRMTPLPHPQSIYNMWSARCDYVARLIDPILLKEKMAKIAPNQSYCRGVGKSARDHWIHSHPTVQPCDLYKDSDFTNNYFNAKSDTFDIDLQPAPRFALEAYINVKKKHICPQDGKNIKERIDEYFTLYNEAPDSSWWGWTIFGLESDAKLPISSFPSKSEPYKAGGIPPTDFDMLWVSGVSKYRSISIVISFCNENLLWLADFTEDYKVREITILSKCGVEWAQDSLPEHVIFMELPNVGYADHSYAYWMANVRAQSAIEDEIVFFFNENVAVRGPNSRSVDSMIQSVDEVGFACLKEPTEGLSVFHESATLNTFETLRESPFYATLFDYAEKLDFTLPVPFTPVCYGGSFAVRSFQISKKSKEFWHNMENILAKVNNLEENRFHERLWASILTDPLDAKTQTLLKIGKVTKEPPFMGALSSRIDNDVVKFVGLEATVDSFYDILLGIPTMGKNTKNPEHIPVFYNLVVQRTTDIVSSEKTITKQMSLFRPEHVIYQFDSVGLKFTYPDDPSFKHYDKLKEESTLHSLWQYCRENKSDKVIYVHKESEHVKDNVLFASGALSSQCANLSDKCNICGTRMTPVPHPHFVGNMWLARCNYVAQLIDPLLFGSKMKVAAPNGAHCRGTGKSASLHWINSHPAAMPCDLHPSPSFQSTLGANVLRSTDYESKLESAPRFESIIYTKYTRNCENNGFILKQRLDEYNYLYGEKPTYNWWGHAFFNDEGLQNYLENSEQKL